MAQDILIIDDEQDIRDILSDILSDEGFETRTAANSHDAFNEVDKRCPSLVILDVFLKNSLWDGMKILDKLKQDFNELPVIMISGHGSIDMAVQAVKNGAYDFVSKPFQTDELLQVIERALDNSRLKRENKSLHKKLGVDDNVGLAGGLIGHSQHIQQLKTRLLQLANSQSRVLLMGDIGTGKNTAAHYIHAHSVRRDAAFIAVDCTTLNEENIEQELFGTQADGNEKRKLGVLEQCHGGSLLLDDISSLSMKAQMKLARLLQTNRFQRHDNDQQIDIDVRFFATSVHDIPDMVERGEFNRELFLRIAVVCVQMPKLSQRSEDITDLIMHFSTRIAALRGKNPRQWSSEVLEKMRMRQWLGNLWELSNLVERLHLVDQTQYDEIINIDDALSALGENGNIAQTTHEYDAPLREAREIFERNYLAFQLERFEGNITRTAEFAGMDRAALHRKLKSLGLVA